MQGNQFCLGAINAYTTNTKIMNLTTTHGNWPDLNGFGRALTLLLLVLTILNTHVEANDGNPRKPRKGKKMKITRNSGSYRGANLQYLEITGGYGVWIRSAQTGFTSSDTPLFGSIEYGNTLSPLSFGLGASFGNRSVKDSIAIDPQYAYVFAKLRFSDLIPNLPNGVELYGLAGANAWRSNLDNFATETTEFSIPGGQKDQGMGMVLGAGVQYRYKGIGLGAQFHWFTGKGTYLLNNESEVGVLTGSKQVNVVLSYRLVWGHKKINCPIYSK